MQNQRVPSFTVHLFLEVLDHGFQPQNAQTNFQGWMNCFRDSALLISLTVHLCKTASVHTAFLSSQTIIKILKCIYVIYFMNKLWTS